jgi:hypothetical protein
MKKQEMTKRKIPDEPGNDLKHRLRGSLLAVGPLRSAIDP